MRADENAILEDTSSHMTMLHKQKKKKSKPHKFPQQLYLQLQKEKIVVHSILINTLF